MSHTALRREARPASGAVRRLHPLTRRFVAALSLMLLGLALFEWGLPAFGVPAYLLPPPSRVLRTLIDSGGELLGHAGATGAAAVSGLIVGAAVGVGFAVVFVYARLLEDALYPWVLVTQTIPAAALAPLLTIWLGDGLAPRVAMAALFAFFPVLVATTRGLRDVSREQQDLMRAWGASGAQVLLHLRTPAALPSLFAGLKVAAALAVVGTIVSELAGAGRGLGFIASIATYHLRTDRVFAAVALAACISLGLHGAIAAVERAIVFWRRPI
jgi:ABC-type nitrate/sulfonate/bicarbonate transport system permease component